MDMSSSRTILTSAQFSPIRLPAGPPLFKFERTIFRPNCYREFWLGHSEIPPASLRRGLLSRLIYLGRVFDFCLWTRSSVLHFLNHKFYETRETLWHRLGHLLSLPSKLLEKAPDVSKASRFTLASLGQTVTASIHRCSTVSGFRENRAVAPHLSCPSLLLDLPLLRWRSLS
jgi:hypothetical protein